MIDKVLYSYNSFFNHWNVITKPGQKNGLIAFSFFLWRKLTLILIFISFLFLSTDGKLKYHFFHIFCHWFKYSLVSLNSFFRRQLNVVNSILNYIRTEFLLSNDKIITILLRFYNPVTELENFHIFQENCLLK